MPVRAMVTVRGRVQGVYFRLSAKEEADARGVAGWVRNRPDGSVEIMAEGERQAVEDMVAWCHKGPVRARVDQVQVAWGTYTGGMTGFEIR